VNLPNRLGPSAREKAPYLRSLLRKSSDPASFIRCLARALPVVILLLSCSDPHAGVANLDSDGTVIVCFGDSITAGHGVHSHQAFPALISESLDMPVVNAGVDGDTTGDALARLERDVLAHDPLLVIVEFGGNDFRKNVDRQKTFENLDRMVGRISERGAIVILLGIRIGLLRDEYLPGYRRVSKKHGALIIPNFMADILGNPRLTIEGIHPNAEGHELIAERVLEAVVPLLEKVQRI